MLSRFRTLAIVVCLALTLPLVAFAAKTKDDAKKDPMNPGTFSGLELRGIGPGLASGRIIDIAVVPSDPATWYVAVASGNVWKTDNAGTTWEAIADTIGSYSIGCVTLDPNNPLTIWLGTGENNSQRSVGYGNGVYKSTDGGKSWTSMGLVNSEHIGRILVHPDDSNTVFVAAQGPLWAPGGDRGLYRTTDGGATWEKALDIDEHTGVSDIVMDPVDHDVLYASAYQRARRVWTLINGGPGSAVYKSVDGGKTWKKLTNGLPGVEMGRIGLAVAPTRHETVYAIVEAADDKGGFFRSDDMGGTWKKMCDYMSSSPQYYNEIFVDPLNPDRIYSMDTWMKVSEDGGKTFVNVGERYKHVDNHALWIDPADTDHLVAGCDGGLYESWNRGGIWEFKSNLPITQFYKITVDNSEPFYYMYGGTQDNNTLGGPVATATAQGIVNSDWFITVGGDGFQPAVDPDDPNIVYSQWQYGGLVRYDRLTGETIDIQPQPEPGDEPLKWNWDSPLMISPHSGKRLYYAAQRIYRSDDRGDSWRPVSGDLTRRLDRNRLEIMGKVWSIDAVAKNASTSFYGNIVSLDESPLVEGLLYAGTDDGLVQVSENGGESWRRIDNFPGVPELAYVADLVASRHDAGTVYALFDNHKTGDFKPYVLKSTDRGRSWKSVSGNLPVRGTAYTLVEDGEKPGLLFVGTEFGLYFTVDGGAKWVELEGGFPTICVKDLAIQRRENDLVVGTFGRGFYVLDDYTPLRQVTPEMLNTDAVIFPVRTADIFIPSTPFGGREKSNQGDAFYTAPNPPYGAVVTYYLKDEIKTRQKTRREAEKKVAKDGGVIAYPSWDAMRAEEREEKPAILVTVTDMQGNVVRRFTGPVSKGFHRVAWDLRYPAPDPTSLKPGPVDNPYYEAPQGPLVAPGRYQVSIAKRVEGEVTPLAGPVTFDCAMLRPGSMPAPDRGEVLAFQKQVADLYGAVRGAVSAAREARTRIDHLTKAIDDTPGAPASLATRARDLDARLYTLMDSLTGDEVVAKYNEPTPPSILDRIRAVQGQWNTTMAPTGTQRHNYGIAADEFTRALADLKQLEGDLTKLEADAQAAGAPWTPGRVPDWKKP